MKQHSQIQKKVLRLYRECLKYAFTLPNPKSQQSMVGMIRSEFQANKDIQRLNMNKIEYLLRIGKNKLQMLKESNVTDINFF